MRTIKFRGKRIDEPHQWEYGYIEVDGKYVWMHTIDGRVMLAIPETIGQFTGLYDKNGKKIFEGDVIKCGMRLYVCEFIEGGFEFRDLSDSKLILKAIVNNSCIIGNVFDNPELLKGGEQ